MSVTIAVDVMSGDHGPRVMMPAVCDFLDAHGQARALVFGREDVLDTAAVSAAAGSRIELRHAEQIVEMDEAPARALRNKRRSSMRLALDAVKAGEANACVSAGNTGALMAMGRYALGMIPGVDRPAIVRPLPTQRGTTYMLDLGANPECAAEHLLQFAVMGTVLAAAMEARANPSVGLLNIGTEENKGNTLAREAAALLADSKLNYHGFVEGNDIYAGTTDVVVCDGFVGNIVLKASEGLAALIADYLRRRFTATLAARAVGILALPVLRRFRDEIDPRRFNGASLLGLGGTVIKSHGGSDRLATRHALEKALAEARSGVPELIRERARELLPAGRAA